MADYMNPFGNTITSWTADPLTGWYTTTALKTKIDELRDDCAPVKTLAIKKPRNVTNKELLAIVDELLQKINTQAAESKYLRERIDKIESKKRGFFG